MEGLVIDTMELRGICGVADVMDRWFSIDEDLETIYYKDLTIYEEANFYGI